MSIYYNFFFNWQTERKKKMVWTNKIFFLFQLLILRKVGGQNWGHKFDENIWRIWYSNMVILKLLHRLTWNLECQLWWWIRHLATLMLHRKKKRMKTSDFRFQILFPPFWDRKSYQASTSVREFLIFVGWRIYCNFAWEDRNHSTNPRN